MEQVEIIQGKSFNRFEIPLKIGLLAAIIKLVLGTVQYQFFLSDWIMTMVISGLSLITGLVFMYVAGVQQRKAMGGYINTREAFQAIFIVILLVIGINFIYDWIYMTYIDPSMLDKLKESSLNFAEKMNAPEERLDEISKQFDEQASKKSDIKYTFLSLFYQVIMYSIVGFIFAALMKRKKPLDIS